VFEEAMCSYRDRKNSGSAQRTVNASIVALDAEFAAVALVVGAVKMA
jgi:hypothetical protein